MFTTLTILWQLFNFTLVIAIIAVVTYFVVRKIKQKSARHEKKQ